VSTTDKTGMTGKPGTYYMCASSPYAESQIFDYSSEFTVVAQDETCPLSGPEIAGIVIAAVVVLACLCAGCYMVGKQFIDPN
jgi:hypothetical protein